MSLIANNICYAKQKAILDTVSVQLKPYQWTVLIGANGAGKSTLINMLGGYYTPDQGQIFLNDRLISDYNLQKKSHILSVLPEDNTVEFAFLVKEIIDFNGLDFFNTKEALCDLNDLIGCLELGHLLERNYLTLSKGEQQRVHIVRVICQLLNTGQSKFLLLDEPFAPLDLKHQKQLINLIKKLILKPVGVLTSIHDINLAWYADQVILLKQGAVIKAGTPEEVLTQSNLELAYDIKVQLIRHRSKSCIVFDLNGE